MTVKEATAAADPEMSELQHYGVEQTAKLLGVSKRWLAGQIAARAVPCTFIAGTTKFTAAHIRRISAENEIDPSRVGRRSA